MRHRHHHDFHTSADFEHDLHAHRGWGRDHERRHGHGHGHGHDHDHGHHQDEPRGWGGRSRRPHHGHPFADASLLRGLWHAIGRHRHRHGNGGPSWGGRGDRGFGDDERFTRGRKFSGEDLQLMLLALIEEAPRHGYELIKALETRTNGFYAPSPGMVYPALTYLEELGYVTVQQEGNRKRYEIAQAGRDYLAAHRDQVDLILAKLSYIAHKMDSVRRAYAAADDESVSGDMSSWHPKLVEARYALKLALLRRADAGEQEQRRIAEILLRAAAEIEGNASGTSPEPTAST